MKKNKYILINLFVVAFFTLFSFVFDQLVINSEDRIREYNFLQKKSFNNYSNTRNIVFNLRDILARGMFKYEMIEDKRDFLQLTIDTLFNEDFSKQAFNIENDEQFYKNIKYIFISKYKRLAYEMINEVILSREIFNGLSIRDLEYDGLDKDKIKIFNKINKNIKNIVTTIDETVKVDFKDYIDKSFDNEDFEVNSNLDILPLREGLTKALDKYKINHNLMYETQQLYSKIYLFYSEEARKFRELRHGYERKKNIYILLGVLSQILSLFFLIFLFKLLLNNNSPKVK